MLKIGRIPAALFFAANFFALAAGANPQNAHSPTAPFVDSAQILKAGSKIREESARDALSSGLPSLAQLIIEDGEKDGGGQVRYCRKCGKKSAQTRFSFTLIR